MRPATSIRVALGIAGCAIVLVLAILWNEFPAVVEPCSGRLPESSPDSGTAVGSYYLGTCLRGPSPGMLVLKLIVAVLAIAGAAVLTTRAATRFRVTAGATAAAFCGLLGLQARHVVDAQIFDVGTFPSFRVVGIGACCLYLFGVLVSVFTERWSPNNWSGRVRDKVPSSCIGARAAQLNR
jgi:hypothetical protein